MLCDIVLLWLAAFPLMGSPGPATLSLSGIGTAFGFRKGVPYLLGIIIGTVSVLLMLATGITALVLAEPALVAALTILAGAYILYLAWWIATAPVGRIDTATIKAPAFVPGFLLAIANPKAFAAIGAVYSGQTIIAGNLAGDAAAKILALTLVVVVVNTAWLGFGTVFSRILSDPRKGRAANVAFAMMLIASVVLALSKPTGIRW